MSTHCYSVTSMTVGLILSGLIFSGPALAGANSQVIPFSKILCDSDVPGALCDATQLALPNSFTVVSKIGKKKVNQLVIDFVSGYCSGTGRANFMSITASPNGEVKTNPDSGDNFSSNMFYFPPNPYIASAGSNGVQVLSQPSKIYLTPGYTVALERDSAVAGVQRCIAELNGHYDLR
ncbi:MAG: hypothetical protein PHT19_11240 [Methylococcus sp.]|nr:hypothetical protein [Methylococcus sp.]